MAKPSELSLNNLKRTSIPFSDENLLRTQHLYNLSRAHVHAHINICIYIHIYTYIKCKHVQIITERTIPLNYAPPHLFHTLYAILICKNVDAPNTNI